GLRIPAGAAAGPSGKAPSGNAPSGPKSSGAGPATPAGRTVGLARAGTSQAEPASPGVPFGAGPAGPPEAGAGAAAGRTAGTCKSGSSLSRSHSGRRRLRVDAHPWIRSLQDPTAAPSLSPSPAPAARAPLPTASTSLPRGSALATSRAARSPSSCRRSTQGAAASQ